MKFITVFLLIITLSAWGSPMKEMSQSEKVKNVFNSLSKDNLKVIDEFYHPKIEFIDPIGEHHGINSVRKYYEGQYNNVKSIKFDFLNMIEEKNTVVAVWKMTLETEALNRGKPIEVSGNSIIIFHPNGQAIYHRDYFDMGEFIYEKIPVLGFLVKKIKEKMKNQ